ncbi:DUF4097 family beta strand repeat-containing protein [Kineosporia babensis]|uniref:DUF4097 domain-containing protein n=1 Tax=Kineosporia babensis TaxID=499548 RepID=A0A9X1SRV9_9ACTN|nr:DUF4097 family beta strand repeat-containing protein [Kineosporia babensis]MCD5310032.1 DUF4097 domain-containing protein [Kineosporia babensis]
MTYEPGSPEAQAAAAAAQPQRRSPWIGPVRVASIVLGVSLVGVGTLAVITQFATRVQTEAVVVDSPVSSLKVKVPSGDVVLRDGPAGGPVQIEVRTTAALSDPSWSHRVKDGTLTLDGACSGSFLIHNCSVAFEVVLPADVKADLDTGSGDVTVTGMNGGTKAHTGSGDIRLGTIGGDIQARAGSGNVHGTQLDSARAEMNTGSGDVKAEFTQATSQVNLKTGSGDVRVSFGAAPTSVNARTGSGDVRILLPNDGTSYDVSGTTGSGDREIEVPTGSQTHRIEANTGSGDVRVGYDWTLSSRPTNG